MGDTLIPEFSINSPGIFGLFHHLMQRAFIGRHIKDVFPVAIIPPVAEVKKQDLRAFRQIFVDILHGGVFRAVSGDVFIPGNFSRQVFERPDDFELLTDIGRIEKKRIENHQ